MSDRGANFVKAFAIHNPLYCFGHRLNNILAICFFQQPKKKQNQLRKSSTSDNPTKIIKRVSVAPVLKNEDLLSDSDSESSELEDESQELNVLNEDTLINFQKKKKECGTTTRNMSVEDIPPEAKKIITLVKQTKHLVKYVKLVSGWTYS
jgi:hypothetical protein